MRDTRVSLDLTWFRRHLGEVLAAAYRRGVTTPFELETVLRVELAQHGLEPRGQVDIVVHSGGAGMRVTFRLRRQRTEASKPVSVLADEKRRRSCGTCGGSGCEVCEGRGWFARAK